MKAVRYNRLHQGTIKGQPIKQKKLVQQQKNLIVAKADQILLTIVVLQDSTNNSGSTSGGSFSGSPTSVTKPVASFLPSHVDPTSTPMYKHDVAHLGGPENASFTSANPLIRKAMAPLDFQGHSVPTDLHNYVGISQPLNVLTTANRAAITATLVVACLLRSLNQAALLKNHDEYLVLAEEQLELIKLDLHPDIAATLSFLEKKAEKKRASKIAAQIEIYKKYPRSC